MYHALILHTCVRQLKEKQSRSGERQVEIETSSRLLFRTITSAILSPWMCEGGLIVFLFPRVLCYPPFYAHFAIAIKRTRH